jgi:flagellar secretion chaperone FliS
MLYRPVGKKSTYIDDSIGTASPGRLLVMLYDRLLLDLERAEAAIELKQVPVAHENLVHAQAIILELRNTLRVELWDGAQALSDLYAFMLKELTEANVKKDARRVASVRKLIEPLREAWAVAALAPAGEVSREGFRSAIA